MKIRLTKCLPWKHENLSPVPRTHVKKAGVIAHVCNPSCRDAGTGSSWGSVAKQTNQSVNPKPSKRPHVNKQGGQHPNNDTWCWPLTSTCMCPHSHEPAHMSKHTHTQSQRLTLVYRKKHWKDTSQRTISKQLVNL